ncbi:MAG: VWA domain-containing protein [Phycisphaerales bacterium]|nr:VWA domain-containing protein [Phycisphaerales bacterium]
MTWLTPGLAGLVAAITVPTLVLLYFLKLRRREVEISSTLLWAKSIKDLQANAPFQRLRRNLLLLLQLIVLALILLALAQPQWSGAAGSSDATVILIDRSASMATMDAQDDKGVGVSRLERAKREALAFVDAMPDRTFLGTGAPGQAMVIAFDQDAEVVQPYTTSKAVLRERIEAIRATDAPTSITAAMRLAEPYVKPKQVEGVGLRPGDKVVMWSDGNVRDLDTVLLHPESTFEYRAVGSKGTHNVGITALRAERPFDDPERAQVFVALEHNGADPVDVDVQLEIDGRVDGVQQVRLPGAEPQANQAGLGGVVFRLDRSTSAIVRVVILTPDALAADNVADLVLPPARRLRTVLVGESTLFLDAALRRLGLAHYEVLKPEQFMARVKSGAIEDVDVAVLSDWCPQAEEDDPAAGLPSLARGGRYLIFKAIPPLPGVRKLNVEGDPEPTFVVTSQREHPIFRHAPIDELEVFKPVAFTASERVRVLARSTDGPLVVEALGGDVRALIVGFDPAETTWVFRPTFPVFLASAVRYLGELSDTGDELGEQGVHPGQTLSMILPTGAKGARLKIPASSTSGADAATVTLELAQDGRVNFGPLRTGGLYELSWDGPRGPSDVERDGRSVRVIPVNLASRAETLIDVKDSIALPRGAVSAAPADATLTAKRAWPWLLLAALGFVMLEWWIYNRRVYV